MGATICGSGNVQILQRELQSPVLGMVVVSDAEGDVDRVARQEWRLLKTLRHVPAQGVKGDLRAEVSSW